MDNTIDMTIYEKIIKKYSSNKDEYDHYLNLPLADKQQIILDFQRIQKRVPRKTVMETRIESHARRMSEVQVLEIPKLTELSEEEAKFYEIVVDSLVDGDEKKKKDLMSLHYLQKHALLDGYRNMPSKGLKRSQSDLKKQITSPRSSNIVKTITSPQLETSSKPVVNPLTEEEIILFKMIADDHSSGNKQVYDMYSNLTVAQKRGILNGFQKSQDYLKMPSELPFDSGFTGWKVNFFSVMSNLLMKYGFWRHLKTEVNTEPFIFSLEVNRMEDKIDDVHIELFEQLVETYIRDGSPQEINLSGIVKKNLLLMMTNHKKGDWEFEESPRALLEPLKFQILTDLRHDPFSRFVASKNGFMCIANSFKDTDVISKDPQQCVRFKLERSIRTTGRIDMDSLAWNLSNAARLEEHYLNPDVLKTMEFSDMLQKYLKENDEEDTILFDRAILAHKKTIYNVLKLKLAFVNLDKQAGYQKQVTTLLSPIMDIGIQYSDDYQIALMVGPWILSFGEDELCIPKRFVSSANVFTIDLDDIECNDKLGDVISKIASVVINWNVEQDFVSRDKNPVKHSDAQDFIADILKVIGSTTSLSSGILSEVLNVFRKQGTKNMKLMFDEEFQFQMGLKQPFMEFTDHKTLDQFVDFVYRADPRFDDYFAKESMVLKAFDAAFWRKLAFLETEIERMNALMHMIDLQLSTNKNLGKEFVRSIKNEKIALDKTIKDLKSEYHKCLPYECMYGDPSVQKIE